MGRHLVVALTVAVGITRASAAGADPLHITVATEPAPNCDDCGPADGKETFYFGTTIGFDAIVVDMETRNYKTGVIPGVGWGLKWRPTWWTQSPSFIALDLFAEAAIAETNDAHSGSDVFGISILPVVTLFGWVSVGYGANIQISLDSAVPDDTHAIMSFGLKHSI
jgi:hypothetical protein